MSKHQNDNKQKQPEPIKQEVKEDVALFHASVVIASVFFGKAGLDQKEKIITDSIQIAKEIREKTRG